VFTARTAVGEIFRKSSRFRPAIHKAEESLGGNRKNGDNDSHLVSYAVLRGLPVLNRFRLQMRHFSESFTHLASCRSPNRTGLFTPPKHSRNCRSFFADDCNCMAVFSDFHAHCESQYGTTVRRCLNN
jgi:hypothetical protein